MTPAEVDQLVGEKVATAITAYAATRNSREGSKAVGGQEIMARNAKRKQDGNQGKNVVNKRQKEVETYEAGKNIKKGYFGNYPYCGRCDRHHPGPCTVICNRCQKIDHKARNCRNPAPIAKAVVLRGCYKCGVVGHTQRSCPKLKRQTLKTYEITTEEDHQNLN